MNSRHSYLERINTDNRSRRNDNHSPTNDNHSPTNDAQRESTNDEQLRSGNDGHLERTKDENPEQISIGQRQPRIGEIHWYSENDNSRSSSESYRQFNTTNDIALLLGQLSCLGILLVGSFQTTLVFPVHALGALLVFVGGNLYCTLQTYIIYR